MKSNNVFILVAGFLVGMFMDCIAPWNYKEECNSQIKASASSITSMERVGEWEDSEWMKVVYDGMYYPEFEYKGVVRNWEMCDESPIHSIALGMTVKISYREINKFKTIKSPCIQWRSFIEKTGQKVSR